MKKVRLILALGMAGGLLLGPPARDRWDFEVVVPYGDADDPFAAEALEKRLRALAPLVGEIVGDVIRLDDVRLERIDAEVAAERALHAAFPAITDLTKETHAAKRMDLVRAGVQMRWAGRLGAYSARTQRIEVNPDAFGSFPAAQHRALLDVVLAHELTHVWQHQRFQAFHEEGGKDTSESELARAAAVEGSAEFVSREVARRLGATEAFELLATSRGDAQATVMAASMWPYQAGLRFVEAAHGALGSPAVWERLFTVPPRTPWDVEHPADWIHGSIEPLQELEAWAERLAWCLGDAPTEYAFQRTWDHDPLRQADVDERVRAGGLASVPGAWSECRGGISLQGTPARGPLAGEQVRLHAWRFPSAALAFGARRELEAAFAAHGPAAWADDEAGEAFFRYVQGLAPASRELGESGEPAGSRSGRDGAVAHTSLLLTGKSVRVREASWAVVLCGAVLLEVQCWRPGSGPAVLDVLDTASRAWTEAEAIEAARASSSTSQGPWARLAALRNRAESDAEALSLEEDDSLAPLRDELLARRLAQPHGEREVVAWLLERPLDVAAWIAALGPAKGREGEEDCDRGPLLAAALNHADADVQRAALDAIAKRRCQPSPSSGEVPGSIATAAGHADAAVRVAAVRAAEVLNAERILTFDRVDALVRDISPAVRVTVAESEDVLAAKRPKWLAALQADADPAVRAAAAPPGEREQSLFLAFLAGMDASDATKRRALIERVRRDLHHGTPMQQYWALQALANAPEDRAQFLPELVRALTTTELREAAATVLCAGGVDLVPAREHLFRMLEHPRWRPDVLRVLAASDLNVPSSVRERLRAWSTSHDARTRCAVALLLLRLEPENDSPLEVLEEAWDDVSPAWRPGLLTAAISRRPGAERTIRLLSLALASPHWELRHAAIKSVGGMVFHEDRLALLLDALPRVGPTAAGEYWKGFLRAADELSGDDLARAGDLLARHVNRWCTEDRLPRLNGDAFKWAAEPDLSGSHSFVTAVDRCVLRAEPSFFQLSLASMRARFDQGRHPESAEVRAALDRLLTLEPPLDGFPPEQRRQFTDLLTQRPALRPDAVAQVLVRSAGVPWEDFDVDIGGLVKGHPDRIQVALALVPGLLGRGTHGCTQVAVGILESAGAAAAPMLPRLRELLPRALPSWRTRIDEVIAAIEAPPSEEPTPAKVDKPLRRTKRAAPPEPAHVPRGVYIVGALTPLAVGLLVWRAQRREWRRRAARERRSDGDGGSTPPSLPQAYDLGVPGDGNDDGKG